jgi:hypothetical protein
MSDSYTKLMRSLATSTICEEPLATRWLWMIMLSQADRDGIVRGSVPGLARIANISLADCEDSLNRFMSPDRYSRTQDDEGRRIRQVDGGWLLINHGKYSGSREPDTRDRAEYMRGYRASKKDPEKQAGEFVTDVSNVTGYVTNVTESSAPIPIPIPIPSTKPKELNPQPPSGVGGGGGGGDSQKIWDLIAQAGNHSGLSGIAEINRSVKAGVTLDDVQRAVDAYPGKPLSYLLKASATYAEERSRSSSRDPPKSGTLGYIVTDPKEFDALCAQQSVARS